MKIRFIQVYVHVGVGFPFSTTMQRFLSEQLHKLVDTGAFEAKYGPGIDLTVFVSAERGTADFRLSAARLYRRGQWVECTVFLPFDTVLAEGGTCSAAANVLVQGVCCVLEKVRIDSAPVNKARAELVRTICESPEMASGSWPISP